MPAAGRPRSRSTTCRPIASSPTPTLHARTDQLAAALAAKGIGKGDRVALLAPNCAEYFELQFACGRLGAIMLPLNWRLAVPELQYILCDSTPSLLIHDRSFADQARQLSTQLLEIDHDRLDSAYEQALASAPPPVRRSRSATTTSPW